MLNPTKGTPPYFSTVHFILKTTKLKSHEWDLIKWKTTFLWKLIWSYRWGENICKLHVQQGLPSKDTQQTFKTQLFGKEIQLENGQKSWTDSPL